MKIKMIDLLNKIANGEEIPNKIAYNDSILKYDDETEDYGCYYGKYLFEYKFATCNNFLNDEVEIIEEPKEIEYEQIEELTCNEYDFEKKTINSLIKNQRKLIDKINKLKEND